RGRRPAAPDSGPARRRWPERRGLGGGGQPPPPQPRPVGGDRAGPARRPEAADEARPRPRPPPPAPPGAPRPRARAPRPPPPPPRWGRPARGRCPAAGLLRRRRGALDFEGQTGREAAALYHLLDHLLPRPDVPPWDVGRWRPRLHAALFVHRVRGLAPGLYLC